MDRTLAVILGILAVLVVCICCLTAFVLLGGMAIFSSNVSFDPQITFGPITGGDPTNTPQIIRPATREPNATGTPGLDDAGYVVPTDTLQTLENTIVPINDLLDIASRLEGKQNIPTTLPNGGPLSVGEQSQFWVSDNSTNQNYQIDATLQYVSDHVYFWVENGISYDEGDLQDLVETFDDKIYPTNREFFGQEWSPGIDEDPRLYIVYARDLGGSVAGYFSTADEYHTEAHEYSNAHEMFFLSNQHVDLGDEFAYSVLAHEFQHMIHWYQDRNEESWLNEGFSELAAFLNGYDVGGTDYIYSLYPDTQLTTWPSDATDRGEHYGASFLFVTYFLDRFGEEATQALVARDENGMVSVENTLEEIGATDPQTGESIDGNDLFLDWVLANYIQDEAVGDGRYTYHTYPQAPRTSATETITNCPSQGNTRTVSQYGVDYIEIACSGDYTLTFEGSMQVEVLPADAHSGEYAFWSNRSDESDTTLTREFDFTQVSSPLTLSYWTWYNIEEDWDYLYLVASEDGGETWQILTTPSGTDSDPVGNSYGWGYTGASGGGPEWIQEQVDISQLAGKQVLLRFEYITDAAVVEQGFLLDDVSIDEIGYSADFEEDAGGWEPAGWARIRNLLPQTFRLAVYYSGSNPRVEYIDLGLDNFAQIPLQLERNERAVFVVSGTTRFTNEMAAYRYSIQP